MARSHVPTRQRTERKPMTCPSHPQDCRQVGVTVMVPHITEAGHMYPHPDWPRCECGAELRYDTDHGGW